MHHTEFYRGLEHAQVALTERPAIRARDRAVVVHDAMASSLAAGNGSARACDRGCAHCCHFPVGITFAEAEHLAFAITRDERLRARILAAAADLADRDWLGLTGIACPLLVDGACACYEHRPLPCRALASADADACAASLTGTGLVPRDDVAFARGLGAAAALSRTGTVHGTRELRSAVSAMLTSTPDDGGAAFLDALAPPN
ncbi:MAG: YkgJ family cysteine cluster protein [bacterium]|nr:YkgJ family cysteine cluster protein [bacterium]